MRSCDVGWDVDVDWGGVEACRLFRRGIERAFG
jgi:hypothetical protein